MQKAGDEIGDVPENIFLCRIAAELTVISNDLRQKKGCEDIREVADKVLIGVMNRLVARTEKQRAADKMDVVGQVCGGCGTTVLISTNPMDSPGRFMKSKPMYTGASVRDKTIPYVLELPVDSALRKYERLTSGEKKQMESVD